MKLTTSSSSSFEREIVQYSIIIGLLCLLQSAILNVISEEKKPSLLDEMRERRERLLLIHSQKFEQPPSPKEKKHN